MKGVISSLALAAAILVAAIVALIYIRDRGAIARNEAAKAVSEEEAAASQRRAAEAAARSDEAKAKQAEADREREVAESQNLKLDVEAKRLEEKNLAAAAELAEKEAKSAAERKQAAADERAAKEAELKDSANRLEIEAQKTKRAEAELKLAERQKAIKELEVMRIKESLEDLNARRAEYEQRLAELDQLQIELQERERALAPDLTVSDLMSVTPADEPPPVEEGGKSEVEEMMKVRNDNIPLGRRTLEEVEQTVQQAREDVLATNRATVISALKAMMESAISEKRAIDAMFYEKTIKSLYPDWRYLGSGEAGGEKAVEERK